MTGSADLGLRTALTSGRNRGRRSLADVSRALRRCRGVRRAPLAPVAAAARRHHDDAARPVRRVDPRRGAARADRRRARERPGQDRPVRVAQPDHPGAEPVEQLDVHLGRRARPGRPRHHVAHPHRARPAAQPVRHHEPLGRQRQRRGAREPHERRARHRVGEPRAAGGRGGIPGSSADPDDRGDHRRRAPPGGRRRQRRRGAQRRGLRPLLHLPDGRRRWRRWG